MNDETIRDEWRGGQKCEIYSISKDKWFTGKICRIFIDDEGEWLEIRYNNSCSKQVQRYSVNVRPHPSYYHETDSKLLMDGYIRMIQDQFLNTMIPKELYIIIFTFYFAGQDLLSDDECISDEEDIDYDHNQQPHDIDIDQHSLSPSPDSMHHKQLAIDYLRRQIQERRKKARYHMLYGRKNQMHSFIYPATLRYRRNRDRRLNDIQEMEAMVYYDPMHDAKVEEEEEEEQMFGVMRMEQVDSSSSAEEEECDEMKAEQIEQCEDADEGQENLSSESSDMIVSEWILDIQRDDILCTMSELLFELTMMFKTVKVQSLTATLQRQLIELKEIMRRKKEYREELLIFGYIRNIQMSLINKNIPTDILSRLCLSYYCID